MGGIYEVAGGSSDTSCVEQPHQTTGSWPEGLVTETLPSATLPVTSAADHSSGASAISGGAIAGIVIGVLAVLAIIAVTAWFILRRRKRSRNEIDDKATRSSMDLGDATEGTGIGQDDNHSAIVEPFRGSTRLSSRYSSSSGSEYPPGTARSANGQRHPLEFPRDAYLALNAAELADEAPDYLRTGGQASLVPAKSSAIQGFHPPASSASPTMTTPQASASGKFDSLPHESIRNSRQTHFAGGTGPPPAGALRVLNHDDDDRPVLAPEAIYDESPRQSFNARRSSGGIGQNRGAPAFRRHADAGRVQQDVVDLPPLYTDVPMDESSPRETPR